MVYLFLLYGLLIGSFLNVVIYRLPRGENIAFPPSHCGSCGARIKPQHLIPVLSYLFLKGKCAHCGERISLQYPLIELLNGLLYVMVYLRFGWGANAVIVALLSSIFVVIGMIDLKSQDILDVTLYAGFAVATVFLLLQYAGKNPVLPHLLAGAVGFLVIALIIFLSRGGMGWGDAWILLLMGMVLGPVMTVLAFFITSITGGITAIFLLLLKKKGGKEAVPFGPFLIFGFFVALLGGQELIRIYFGWF